MSRSIAIAVFLLVTPPTVCAGELSEREAVLAVVDALFAAVAAKDTQAFSRIVLDDGMTYAQVHAADGTVKLRARSNREQLEALGKSRDRMQERYEDPTVLIHESIAMVWTSYQFHLNGKLSHCGFDLFELLKVEGVWKIGNAIWTVEPAGCPATLATSGDEKSVYRQARSAYRRADYRPLTVDEGQQAAH